MSSLARQLTDVREERRQLEFRNVWTGYKAVLDAIIARAEHPAGSPKGLAISEGRTPCLMFSMDEIAPGIRMRWTPRWPQMKRDIEEYTGLSASWDPEARCIWLRQPGSPPPSEDQPLDAAIATFLMSQDGPACIQDAPRSLHGLRVRASGPTMGDVLAAHGAPLGIRIPDDVAARYMGARNTSIRLSRTDAPKADDAAVTVLLRRDGVPAAPLDAASKADETSALPDAAADGTSAAPAVFGN